MKKFLEDFKSFAVKGNVIDLAIGVIIGGAFGKIVTSLVQDILMPLLSLITGKFNLGTAQVELTNVLNGNPVVLKYGSFLQNIVDFLLISLSIFVAIRLMSRFNRKKEQEEIKEEVKEEIKQTEEVILLAEIRDILKNRKGEEQKETIQD